MTTSVSDSTLDHLRRIVQSAEPEDPRYHIVETIGQGGMGTVYLAEDAALHRRVAMKVLRGVQDANAVERMLREARVIARLEHPGIVPVHDAGHLPDGRVYYIMKLVQGRRLDEYASESASLQETLRVFERICETVAFAHAHGVIHRDLKPQNVMVGPFGEVLVLDFGVAKIAAATEPRPSGSGMRETPSDAPHTAQGTILGTPAYMPPEQARGEVERIDERSDVYALGGILYFLLTGQPPQTQMDGPGPIPPRQLRRGSPRRLEAICLKALSAEPPQRYARAAELAADVARFRSGQAVLAHREGVPERLARWAWWYRVPILIVAAYLLMRSLLILWQRQ